VQQTRRGKGNALACGFEAATGDVIAMVDADGSTDPGEIPRFVTALVSGADFAKGTRFAPGGGSSDITRLRMLGNRLLSELINLCYGTHYTDLCYGFNVFWRKHVPVLGLDVTSPPSNKRDGRLWGDGFEIETLIHMRVAEEGLRVAEVPSFEHRRIHGVSNLDAFSDGLRVLLAILVERRRARSRDRARRPALDVGPTSVVGRDSAPLGIAAIPVHVLFSIERGLPPSNLARSAIIGTPTLLPTAVPSGRSRRRALFCRRRVSDLRRQPQSDDPSTSTQLLRGE
jgi:hypothetical protein